ncbi:hypothetical protein D3C77_395060 [compost metagenome]
MAEDVFAFQAQRLPVVVPAVEISIRKMGDQVGQLVVVDLRAGEVLIEHILELLLVLALDGFHGVVDQPTHATHFFRLILPRPVPRQRRFGG